VGVLGKQLNLPFDQYQRYRIVADVIERLREGSELLQILDIGEDTILNSENVWLKEHAENGLPHLDGTREFFEGRGDSVSVLPNGDIFHWLAIMCLTHYSSKFEGELAGVFDLANAFYNEFIYESDNTEPCYRYLLVRLRELTNTNLDELVTSSADSDRTSQSSALFSTLSVISPDCQAAGRACERNQGQVLE